MFAWSCKRGIKRAKAVAGLARKTVKTVAVQLIRSPLHDEANMKKHEKHEKLKAHVMHVYIEHVCFMFASSRKQGISVV